MDSKTLVDLLRAIPLFAEISDQRLHWLAEQCSECWLKVGERLFTEGDLPNGFHIVLDGTIQVTKRIGDEDVVLFVHHASDFLGELPLLTEMPFVSSARAIVPTHLVTLGPATFQEMLATCPTVSSGIMRMIAKRLQQSETMIQQREKLSALGKLSAGLAHELNNPASAAKRAASSLREVVLKLHTLTLQLSAHCLPSEQVAFLEERLNDALAHTATPPLLDPLTQSDREEALAAWLEHHQVADSWKLAPTFVAAGLDLAWLENMLLHIPSAPRETVLFWIVTSLDAVKLVGEVEESTSRMVDLVKAVKGYSHIDTNCLKAMDIHESIESALTLLRHRTRGGVSIQRHYEHDLPSIEAYPSELTQVWTNLLDNALDAVGERGSIAIITACENDVLLVEIVDNGSGIPAEIQPRIFEPFFTTKDVGEGVGLGLDLAYRIVVNRHHGDIHVTSSPGETRFQVRLPIKQAGAGEQEGASSQGSGKRAL